MPLSSALPYAGAIAFAAFAIFSLLAPRGVMRAWQVPAGLCGLFLVFSLYAVVTEGPLGFWAEHSRNLWGNQIWFDLLLAIAIGWALLLPAARSLGMRPLPWLLLIVCTGCIGLLAMLARVMYLQQTQAAARGGGV